MHKKIFLALLVVGLLFCVFLKTYAAEYSMPDKVSSFDKKYFKYFLGLDNRSQIKVKLVAGRMLSGNVKRAFVRKDILDVNNHFIDGIYYIDKNGKIYEYDINNELVENLEPIPKRVESFIFPLDTPCIEPNSTHILKWKEVTDWGTPNTNPKYVLQVKYDDNEWVNIDLENLNNSIEYTIDGTKSFVTFRIKSKSDGGESKWTQTDKIAIKVPQQYVINDKGSDLIKSYTGYKKGDILVFNYTSSELMWNSTFNAKVKVIAYGAKGGGEGGKGSKCYGVINVNSSNSIKVKAYQKGIGGGSGAAGGKDERGSGRGQNGQSGAGGTLVKFNDNLILAAGGGGGQGGNGASQSSCPGGEGGKGNFTKGKTGTVRYLSAYCSGSGGSPGKGGKGAIYNAGTFMKSEDGKDSIAGSTKYDGYGGAGGGGSVKSGSEKASGGGGGSGNRGESEFFEVINGGYDIDVNNDDGYVEIHILDIKKN